MNVYTVTIVRQNPDAMTDYTVAAPTSDLARRSARALIDAGMSGGHAAEWTVGPAVPTDY